MSFSAAVSSAAHRPDAAPPPIVPITNLALAAGAGAAQDASGLFTFGAKSRRRGRLADLNTVLNLASTCISHACNDALAGTPTRPGGAHQPDGAIP